MKSIFKNSVYNLIYKLFMLAFPLVSSIYVSRILMPAGVGQVAYAQNIVSYFIVFAGLGMSNYGIREIGKVQKERREYSKVFSELFLILLISTTFCTIIYYGWMTIFVPFPENQMLYAVAGLQLVLSAFNVDWFYQGMEEYRYITSRSIIIKIFTLVMMFLFVRECTDVVPYALMTSVALAGNNIINVMHLRKYLEHVEFRTLEIVRHLKPLVLLLSTNISVEMYTKLDTTTLGILAQDVNVGYYSYATKIATIVVNLAAAISVILLPRLSYYRKQGNTAELNRTVALAHKGILALSLPAVVGLILMAENIIVFLFGEAFAPAALTVRILSLLVLIKSIGNLYGVQVLLAFNGEKLLLFTTIAGAVSNVVMNILMIPLWQENGAAVASVISELIVCIIQVYYARKFVEPSISGRFYVQIVLSTILMAVMVVFLKLMRLSGIAQLSLCCVAGMLVYYICGMLMKNEIIILVNSKLFGRLKKTGGRKWKE